MIWSVMTISVIAYYAVAHFKFGAGSLNTVIDLNDPMAMVMVMASLVSLAMSFILPSMIRTPPKADSRFLKLVIRLVFLESIAVFGMALSFSRSENMMLPFAIIALMGFIFACPIFSENPQR